MNKTRHSIIDPLESGSAAGIPLESWNTHVRINSSNGIYEYSQISLRRNINKNKKKAELFLAKKEIGKTKFKFEYTDTFGGEANYSWVKRHEEEFPSNISDLALMRRAKKWAGLTNIKGRSENWGDTLAFYPRGFNTVLFINAEY